MPREAATVKKPAKAEEKKPKQAEVVSIDLKLNSVTLPGFEVLAAPGKASLTQITKMIERACALQQLQDILDEQVSNAKTWFKQHCAISGEKEFVTKRGAVKYTLANSFTVKAEKVGELEQLFGAEFLSFVSPKMSYGCQAKLRNLLSDGDYEHQDVIRNAVEIKQSESVKFTPITK